LSEPAWMGSLEPRVLLSAVDPYNMGKGDWIWTLSNARSNTGTRPMHEVAQLYIHDRVASMTRPVRSLKGFKHLDLKPGKSATVEFTLSRDDLAFVHPDTTRSAEPGLFDVWIAPSAVGGTPASFTLTA